MRNQLEVVMASKRIHTAFLLAGLVMAGSGASVAQTSVAASVYGAFSGTTNGNNTTQSPSNAAGAMIEVRHISNPIVGFEGTYSFNRANEVYRFTSPVPCPPPSGCQPAAVSANAHEVTADWVASVKVANLRPFALAGVGLLFNQPSGSQANTQSQTKPVFVYGAGLDWGLLPHLGLRFQYRGNLYRAPNLTKLYTSVDAFTHTSEPMIGAYLRF
jgi:opacity protein-like surface antigen